MDFKFIIFNDDCLYFNNVIFIKFWNNFCEVCFIILNCQKEKILFIRWVFNENVKWVYF